MAKILILANNDVGLYKFRKELIEKLVIENEVYISLPHGEMIPSLIKLGCKFIETPLNRRGVNPITDLKLLMKYRKIIKKVKPSLVLTYTIKPNVYGGMACRSMRVPLIANITGLGSAVENEGILQKITLLMYKVSLKKAKCVFFQNRKNELFFLDRNIITGKHRRIPGSGVNLGYYSPIAYPEDDKVHFMFIARVMKEKGIEQYLDAAKYIKAKYKNVFFHILGYCEQDYKTKLENMQKQGIIEYHGMQNDVRKFHALSHCTIHPTYYPEGMSNVLLESAASGRPIITTNRAGCREIVENNNNGFIVEEKNSEDLIEKIETFIELSYDDKKMMGFNGRKKVEREFDRKIVIDAYLKEMNLVLDE